MKKRSIALLLALMMCLSLLAACGGKDTPDPSEPTATANTPAPAVQQPQTPEPEPATEAPTQEEPTTEEPTEPETEPEPEEHEGTKLLALLQEEWNNGFFEGEGPKHTYNVERAFLHDGVVYIQDINDSNDWSSYDIASKEFHELSALTDIGQSSGYAGYYDGNFYFINDSASGRTHTYTRITSVYDCNGALLNSFQLENNIESHSYCFFEKGILADGTVLLSHSLEKIADIPVPQREVEHGLKEDVKFKLYTYVAAADGTVYAMATGDYWYRLNLDTYEWEDAGEAIVNGNSFYPLFGKYIAEVTKHGILNRVTGEQVFNWDDAGVYPAASTNRYLNGCYCYFGDDRYLGYSERNKEYRWINLTDLSMSEPLPFPNVSSDSITILNDTYCVYRDRYGLFLWNYNTGEEETIMLFDN